MPLTATVTLHRGRYEAGGRDDRLSETVPSPFRLFCALVSVAGRVGDPSSHQGLRWLERQLPPDVIIPPVLDAGATDGYFVTNKIKNSGGSMTHPGRVNNSKHRAWVNFRGPGFRFVWAEAPDGETLELLKNLARGVTYLGRVESTASVEFSTDEHVPLAEHEERFTQIPLGQPGSGVPAPYPGCLEALVDTHELGGSAWEVARSISYGLVAPPAQRSAITGPFDSLLVFSVLGQPLSGSHVLDVTAAFRAAAMSRIERIVGHDSIPPAVHGHDGTVGHLAYLALPFVGNVHADGRLLGLAVATPLDLDPEARRVVGVALTDQRDPFTAVSYGRSRNGSFEIAYDPFSTQRVTLAADRWRGGRTGSRTWTSVTPMMLDRFPERRETHEEAVAASVARAGYPEPESVEVSPSGFVTGSVRYRNGWHQALGSRPRRPLWHVRMRFTEPVIGPVIVGALRFIGGGLCIPARPEVRDEPVKASTASL